MQARNVCVLGVTSSEEETGDTQVAG